jgi:Na+-driven multidrug efflux pump
LKYGYVAWSTPFVIVSTAFSNLVRAKGKSTEALNGILIGTIQNIVLNRLFILWLGYRIAGAAWATAIGYTAANAYYVILLTGKDSHLTISIACFNMRKETVGPSQAVIRLSCFAGLGMGVILTLLCGVFSEELISCVIDSEGIREYGTPLVRTLLLSGPVMGILLIYINTLQAIGAEAAQPVADILSLLLAVWLFWRTEKRMGKAPSFV